MRLIYKDYQLTNDDLALLGKICAVCKKIKSCKNIALSTDFCALHKYALYVAYKKYKKQLKEDIK